MKIAIYIIVASLAVASSESRADFVDGGKATGNWTYSKISDAIDPTIEISGSQVESITDNGALIVRLNHKSQEVDIYFVRDRFTFICDDDIVGDLNIDGNVYQKRFTKSANNRVFFVRSSDISWWIKNLTAGSKLKIRTADKTCGSQWFSVYDITGKPHVAERRP